MRRHSGERIVQDKFANFKPKFRRFNAKAPKTAKNGANQLGFLKVSGRAFGRFAPLRPKGEMPASASQQEGCSSGWVHDAIAITDHALPISSYNAEGVRIS